ncbi:MAG TPA: phosphatidate cytidylyltransferase [Acidobacteria bacterium]|nr:phosphatidate cytidylyltransferase [Acidobacteriota bacterium]
MSRGDMVGLVASYVYAFGLLFVVEAVGGRLGWPQRVTRKLTHIGAGMWIWGLFALFDHWRWGVVPFATFIVLNWIFYRKQAFKSMDSEDSSPGTIYFSLSITILLVWLWRTGGAPDHAPLAAAAIMAMTWGDAMASLVGQTWGRHRYTVFGHTRSWEGSAAMAVATFAAVSAVLLLMPGSALSPASVAPAPGLALALALLTTVVATAAEAISPAGTDNLSVPLLSGLVLYGTASLLHLGL